MKREQGIQTVIIKDDKAVHKIMRDEDVLLMENILLDDCITLKELSYLFIHKGFTSCEIWTEEDYLATHFLSKSLLSHQIASKKIDILVKNGFSRKYAQWFVFWEGKQKANKKNLSLLGTPIWTGTIEELSNETLLYDKIVSDCHFRGIFRRKIDIIVK